jgi:hypothetical protein
MIHAILSYISDAHIFLHKLPFSKKRKRSLIWAYGKLKLARKFKYLQGSKTISFLGYTVRYRVFNEFYWVFREIFVENNYYFDFASVGVLHA